MHVRGSWIVRKANSCSTVIRISEERKRVFRKREKEENRDGKEGGMNGKRVRASRDKRMEKARILFPKTRKGVPRLRGRSVMYVRNVVGEEAA